MNTKLYRVISDVKSGNTTQETQDAYTYIHDVYDRDGLESFFTGYVHEIVDEIDASMPTISLLYVFMVLNKFIVDNYGDYIRASTNEFTDEINAVQNVPRQGDDIDLLPESIKQIALRIRSKFKGNTEAYRDELDAEHAQLDGYEKNKETKKKASVDICPEIAFLLKVMKLTPKADTVKSYTVTVGNHLDAIVTVIIQVMRDIDGNKPNTSDALDKEIIKQNFTVNLPNTLLNLHEPKKRPDNDGLINGVIDERDRNFLINVYTRLQNMNAIKFFEELIKATESAAEFRPYKEYAKIVMDALDLKNPLNASGNAYSEAYPDYMQTLGFGGTEKDGFYYEQGSAIADFANRITGFVFTPQGKQYVAMLQNAYR
jgi:hypothetical protein